MRSILSPKEDDGSQIVVIAFDYKILFSLEFLQKTLYLILSNTCFIRSGSTAFTKSSFTVRSISIESSTTAGKFLNSGIVLNFSGSKQWYKLHDGASGDVISGIIKMNEKMAFNKKDLDNGFKSLAIEGFDFKKEVMGYSWTRTHQNRIERIIIGHGGYPDSFNVYTPAVDIYFYDIEDVINPLLDLFNIQNRYGATTIQKGLINIEGVDYNKLQFEINSDSTFETVIHEVKKIISKGAISFFEQYSTLMSVAHSVERMNEDELSRFISGIVGIKIPLIKKIAQSDTFIPELKYRNEFYTNEAVKYPQYFKDHEKVFYALFSADLKNVL